jgi:hypothetical protein
MPLVGPVLENRALGRYNMIGYYVTGLGALIVIACAFLAIWTLAEKLLPQ